MSIVRSYWALVVMLVGVGLIGCSGGPALPKTIPVSGVVKLKGQPVKNASVGFLPVNRGRPAVGSTDAGGNFRLTTFKTGDGAIPGDYKVTITAYEQNPGEVGEGGVIDEKIAAKPRKWRVPEKYSNSSTSGLKASVSPSSKEFTFNLEG